MLDASERREPVIHFIGEQDGRPERELKAALCELFMKDVTLHRAYLAQVRYDETAGVSVALGLVAASESRGGLIRAVNGIFHALFNAGEHLDVFFPSAKQERELSSVCRPFFPAQ